MGLLLQGFFSAIWGSAGIVLSILFHPPQVTQAFFLIVPLLAQALGYVLELDQ
jgi:hypothetical protein